MENSSSKKPEVVYSEFLSNKKEGETAVLRHIGHTGPLPDVPEEMNTALKIFEYGVKNSYCSTFKILDNNSEIKQEFYYGNVQDYAQNYVNYLYKNNLINSVELDGKKWKFMGIYCKNCPEWTISHFGNMYGDITTVSIYDTLGLTGLEHIFNLTKLENLVVQDHFLSRIIELHQKKATGNLKNLFVVGNINENETEQKINTLKQLGFFVKGFADVYLIPTIEPINISPCTPDSVALISFTSGSTGLPKGALITHRALASQRMYLYQNIDIKLNSSDVHFSYLPYPHIFESIVLIVTVYEGVNTVYYSGDPRRISFDMVAAKPTILFSVPRVLMRIYDGVKASLSNVTGPKAKLIELAIKEKLKNSEQLGKHDHFLFDKLVFQAIANKVMGRPNLKFIFTGSAPIEGSILNFLKILFSCPVIEAYGLTEVVGGITLTKREDSIVGHVGGPVIHSEIKLIDAPEFNYYTTDKDQDGNPTPRGEIIVRSTSIFSGYLCNPEQTKEMLDSEGWVHTGDIGTFLAGNRLKIIDRRKNIFKLSQGEYIAPEKVENCIKLSKYVLQSYVFGVSTQCYVVVLVVVEPAVLTKLAAELNITFRESNELLNNAQISDVILKDIVRLCKENKLNSLETPQRIMLTFEPFSIDNGMLTSTMKIVRSAVKNHWAERLSNLYN